MSVWARTKDSQGKPLEKSHQAFSRMLHLQQFEQGHFNCIKVLYEVPLSNTLSLLTVQLLGLSKNEAEHGRMHSFDFRKVDVNQAVISNIPLQEESNGKDGQDGAS